MHPISNQPRSTCAESRRAFTLLELLVVMGILLVLAVLTAVSVGTLTRDAKISAGTNQVVAALGTARGIAIRDNAYVIVAFRMKRDPRVVNGPREPQIVQAVTAKWTGEVIRPAGISDMDTLAERFIAVPGVPVRDLPANIRVAGPSFSFSTQNSVGQNDRYWRTQPRFVGNQTTTGNVTTYTPDLTRTEVGSMIAVLFGPDGRVLSRNPQQVLEIEVNESADQDAWATGFLDSDGSAQPKKGTTAGGQSFPYWQYDEPTDQPLIDYVPYLAVFDDGDLRSRFNTLPWGGPANNAARRNDITSYVEELADRITFNRYTGVPGVAQK
ncbi:MAG: prepilin-type N-terminal cleavage/methylation domain-containing protein [Phycisphaerae bacterium]|nr:prepilin-type N-terminal cleavage/methylation domain-containing protein [Phycisphaerae bacterium]